MQLVDAAVTRIHYYPSSDINFITFHLKISQKVSQLRKRFLSRTMTPAITSYLEGCHPTQGVDPPRLGSGTCVAWQEQLSSKNGSPPQLPSNIKPSISLGLFGTLSVNVKSFLLSSCTSHTRLRQLRATDVRCQIKCLEL